MAFIFYSRFRLEFLEFSHQCSLTFQFFSYILHSELFYNYSFGPLWDIF